MIRISSVALSDTAAEQCLGGGGGRFASREGRKWHAESVTMAMRTMWYAVELSSNQGSVTFGGVGLLMCLTAEAAVIFSTQCVRAQMGCICANNGTTLGGAERGKVLGCLVPAGCLI